MAMDLISRIFDVDLCLALAWFFEPRLYMHGSYGGTDNQGFGPAMILDDWMHNFLRGCGKDLAGSLLYEFAPL